MKDYKTDYNYGHIPCSATVVVVHLAVVQTTVKSQLMLNNTNIKHVSDNYIDYKYNNTICHRVTNFHQYAQVHTHGRKLWSMLLCHDAV